MIAKFKALGWFGLFILNLVIVYLIFFAITDDWFQSLIVAVFGFPFHLIFFVFGSGCIIKGFFQIAERPILKAAIEGKQPKDGHRVAIFGTIEPISKHTHTPFGQKACVGYKYFIKHRKYVGGSDSNVDYTYPIIAAGWALAPAKIVTQNDVIRMGGFPLIEEFSAEGKRYDDSSRQDLDTIITTISFKKAGLQKWIVRNIETHTPSSVVFGESLYKRIEDNNKEFRKNTKFFRKLYSDYSGRRPDKIVETLIPIGAEVCVFGTYLANQKVVVPGRWRTMRLINGDRSKVIENFQMDYWVWFILGLILISIEIGAIIFFTS